MTWIIPGSHLCVQKNILCIWIGQDTLEGLFRFVCLHSVHEQYSSCVATTPSLFYLLLVKYTWHFWHPLLAPLAPKLPFGWQITGVIQRPRHDISKVFHRRRTNFQDSAPTCGAELPMQSGTTPIICFVYGRFFGLGSITEGGDRDFRRQSECRAEEFLASHQYPSTPEPRVSSDKPYSSYNGTEMCEHRPATRQWCT